MCGARQRSNAALFCKTDVPPLVVRRQARNQLESIVKT
jgi:hypothetical protein